MKTTTRHEPGAMRARAAAASSRIGERLARLWTPMFFERFDGSEIACHAYADWEREVARYERESGGFTPRCAR